MRRGRRRVASRAFFALLAFPALVRAGTPAKKGEDSQTRTEAGFLLAYLAWSACSFYRNGSWHDANAARAHLRGKYDRLSVSNEIGNAEDFIDKVATRSSLTGEEYAVRCTDGASVPTATWLRAGLERLRRH